MMKVIFLDIDGVLNSDKWLKTQPDWDSIYNRIDPAAISLLNHLISWTGAHVVISSSWRISWPKELTSVLEHGGFEHLDKVIGFTPIFGHSDNSIRGDEIEYWLKQQYEPIENYVILDDGNDMLESQMPHLVRTSYKTGLSEENVKRAVTILTCESLCEELNNAIDMLVEERDRYHDELEKLKTK